MPSSWGNKVARINIEQVWWTDPRREKLGKLLGDLLLADAIAIRAWKLAQDFWGNNRGLVPSHIFETLQENSKLIQANLAEVREDGVYIRGSSQYLDWVAEKRESAKKGGEKSAKRPRDKKGRLLKLINSESEDPSKAQVTSNTDPSQPNTVQASGSGSFSGSTSSKELVVAETPTRQKNLNSVQKQETFVKSQAFRDFLREKNLYGRLKHITEQLASDWGSVENLRIEMNRLFAIEHTTPKSDEEKIDFVVGTLVNRARS